MGLSPMDRRMISSPRPGQWPHPVQTPPTFSSPGTSSEYPSAYGAGAMGSPGRELMYINSGQRQSGGYGYGYSSG